MMMTNPMIMRLIRRFLAASFLGTSMFGFHGGRGTAPANPSEAGKIMTPLGEKG
jgi:hypothetical protein